MVQLLADLRFALRGLIKIPRFTGAAILTMSVGIGAITTMFSVVDAVLLRPLPYRESKRLVQLWGSNVRAGNTKVAMSAGDFEILESGADTLESIAAYRSWDLKLTTNAGSEPIQATWASPELFQVLETRASLGRALNAGDAVPGHEHVVVLSHSFWQARFGSTSNVIGQPIVLDNKAYTVIGIMPANFAFPDARTSVWIPLVLTGEEFASRDKLVVARLRKGNTIDEAGAQLRTLAARLRPLAGGNPLSVRLVPLREEVVRGVRSLLLLLLGAVGFLLLIACANVTNLLLARGVHRAKELAVRQALGATRLRLARQLLTESFVLVTVGGGIAVAIAPLLLRLFVWLAPTGIPRLAQVALDFRVLLFTSLICIATAIVVGLLPALSLSTWNISTLVNGTVDVSSQLRKSGQAALGRLVTAEISLAFVLLAGAGLMINSIWRIVHQPLGFDPDNVETLWVALDSAKYQLESARASFYSQATDRVAALPGMDVVAFTSSAPAIGTENVVGISVGDRWSVVSATLSQVRFQKVTPGYFHALCIPLLNGRLISDDDVQGRPGAIVVNQAMARKFWPAENPLGRTIRIDAMGGFFGQVVGIVGDARDVDPRITPDAEMYLSLLQLPPSEATLIARTTAPYPGLVPLLQREIWSIDKSPASGQAVALKELLSRSTATAWSQALLSSGLALIGLLLAATGVYGLMSYTVTQQTREVGIRMALGSPRNYVLLFILRSGLWMILKGLAFGVIGSAFLAQFMAAFLYGVRPLNAPTYMAVAVGLCAVGLMACYVPAMRATKLDVIAAIRQQ